MITEEHLAELQELINEALENDDLLSDWERDFLAEWEDRLLAFGERVNVSDKQQYVFDKIKLKLEKQRG